MPRLTPAKPHEVVRVLERLGFSRVRQEGSHAFYRHGDGRTTVVPIHTGKEVGRGLLKKILDDAGISPEQFAQLK